MVEGSEGYKPALQALERSREKARRTCRRVWRRDTHAQGRPAPAAALPALRPVPAVNARRRLTLAPRRRPHCTLGGRDGGRVGEDAASVGVGGFRLRSACGLAGEPAKEALPGLEEAEAAGQAGDDAEEAGPGLSGRLAMPARAHGSPRPPARGAGPSRVAC